MSVIINFLLILVFFISSESIAKEDSFKKSITLGGHEVVFEGVKESYHAEGSDLVELVVFKDLVVYFADEPDRFFYLRAAYGLDELVFNYLCSDLTEIKNPVGSVLEEGRVYLYPSVFEKPEFIVLYENRSFRQIPDFSNVHFTSFSCRRG